MRLTAFIAIPALLITGCLCPPPRICPTEGPYLPSRPQAIAIESNKTDIKKFPNIKWIKEPKVDVNKGIACWSFKDVETISNSLTEWQDWADAVEETVGRYNKSLAGVQNKEVIPWYKKIFTKEK